MNKKVNMTPYAGHYLLANVYVGGSPSPSLITIKKHQRGGSATDFYWYTGPSWASATFVDKDPERGQAVIMQDYGLEKDISFEEHDQIELDLLVQHYPPEESDVIVRDDLNGWISPDGKFYPTRYGGHNGLARRIAAKFYRKLLSGYDADEELKKEWIAVAHLRSERGLFFIGRSKEGDDFVHRTMTRPQANMIKRLLLENNLPGNYLESRKVVGE